MKLIAIRFYKVDVIDQFKRISDEELWFSTNSDFEKEMNEEILPWASHHGFMVEVTGKIYSKDAQ